MNRVCKITVIVAGFAFMTGCASMSSEECLTADWYTIGFEDGARGQTAEAIGPRRKACAKAGVTADFSRYEEGRQQGLRQFCQPARAYEVGRRGGNYAGVCPSDLEDEFVIAYNEGRELYVLENAVRTVENKLRRIENQIDRHEDDLKSIEKRLISPEANTEERVAMLSEAKDLAGKIGELENERDNLMYELGVRRERLEEYLSVRSSF